MVVNAPVSGGRWRCVCCELFVSHQELQVCGLTQAALTKFANEVSSTQDRVEFRAGQSLHLLPPPKLRYGGGNNKRGRGGPSSGGAATAKNGSTGTSNGNPSQRQQQLKEPQRDGPALAGGNHPNDVIEIIDDSD